MKMPTTPLTTREAWLVIAEAFDEYARTGEDNAIAQEGSGLCNAVTSLGMANIITYEQSVYMRARIGQSVVDAIYSSTAHHGCYIAPPGQAHAARRAAYARTFAAELE